MKRFTCRLCRQQILDENYCPECMADQFRDPGPTWSDEKEAELNDFVADLITKAKANGYPKGKVS